MGMVTLMTDSLNSRPNFEERDWLHHNKSPDVSAHINFDINFEVQYKGIANRIFFNTKSAGNLKRSNRRGINFILCAWIKDGEAGRLITEILS